MSKLLVGSSDRYHYQHKNRVDSKSDFDEYLKKKLWPGHDLAWKAITAARYMFDKPLTEAASDLFKSFFGNDAMDPLKALTKEAAEMFQAQNRTLDPLPSSYFELIKAMFKNISWNLFDEYTYICEDCNTGFTKSGLCRTKGGRIAKTDDSSPYDLYMCVENQKNYSVLGMASLILHENVHRCGFEFDDYLDHCERNRKGIGLFRNLNGNGEWWHRDESRLTSWSVIETWRNCDSYACMSIWAYEQGYLWSNT